MAIVPQTFSTLSGVEPITATAPVPVPSGVAAGDIILVGLYRESMAAVTPPAGFTQKVLVDCSGSKNHEQVIFWKRASAADSGTYTFSWTGAAWREAWAARISGAVSSGDPFDTPLNSATTNSVGVDNITPAVATLTPTVNDALVCFSGTNWLGGSWTPPAGFTERTDHSGAITLATLAQTTAAATGSVSATCSGYDAGRTGVVFVIKPQVTTQVSAVAGVCAIGSGSTAVGRKSATTNGRAATGGAAAAAARKVGRATATSPLGTAAAGTGRKVSSAGGRASAGTAAIGAARKTARAQANAGVGLGSTTAARKLAAVAGRAAVGWAAWSGATAPIIRAVAARLQFGLSGGASAVKRSRASATAAAGVSARGSASKRSPAAGVAGAGVSAQVVASKRSPAAGVAAVGIATRASLVVPGQQLVVRTRLLVGRLRTRLTSHSGR